ncbi:conserved hypothetical protein [Pediculus humanus corporis]|uniref:Chitin-binding type-2 domain-containing protein n=1 Tax=Pediculus humanus subsp. corporis TaxID=121224 RepID=E0VAB5_PEDHC|nr:uncharacterized protein Phum_PHUM034260 [Pediculus humanus corporis]EEB10321.1 conserved hypothetical protein [Pediculus humanus corporis]
MKDRRGREKKWRLKGAVGFYADVEHHCQIFHMCDEDGRRIPYICANDTSFNQKYRICDWEYNFDCANSNDW